MKTDEIKSEYDFSNSTKNPYVKKLKKQITIRISNSAIEYFKKLSEETGVPYQNLIDLYLLDCAKNKVRPNFNWE